MEDNLSRDLWNVYTTACKMLSKRNFNIPKEHLFLTYDQFTQQFLTLSDLTISVNNNTTNEVVEVHFLEDTKEDSKVGIKPIKACIEKVNKKGCNHLIIVAKEGITPAALVKIEEIVKGITPITEVIGDSLQSIPDTIIPVIKMNIETFKYADLMIDITEHELVPKHIKMTTEEKKKFLEETKYEEKQFPRILVSDPVSRFYNFKKGDLIKIERVSETAGEYNSYRLVV